MFHNRKIKVFKVASPIFLMICLVGCGIMYLEMAAIFPILDMYSCIATKWTRHMGKQALHSINCDHEKMIKKVVNFMGKRKVEFDDDGRCWMDEVFRGSTVGGKQLFMSLIVYIRLQIVGWKSCKLEKFRLK
jgi:hypothetical protein